MPELQAQPRRRRLRPLQADRVVGLGEIDDPAIVAEIKGQEVRVPVQPQPLPDQRVELARQEVGQPERADLLLRQLLEPVEAREEGVAVRPLDPPDPLLGQHPVQFAPGAAVAIGDQDPRIVRPVAPDRLADRLGDELRLVVQLRRQALQLHMGEAVCPDQRQDLAGERPAGENQGGLGQGHGGFRQLTAPRWLCLRAMNSLAVSTATAASRQ
jgi:hypothetical protein